MTAFYNSPSNDYEFDYENTLDHNETVEDEELGFWQELKSQVWNEIEEFLKGDSKHNLRVFRL